MPRNVEYTEVYDATLRDIEAGNVDDVYKDIISKEKIHMDMLNRIIKQKDAELDNKPMLDTSISRVIVRVVETAAAVADDLRARKPVAEVFAPPRRLYLGLLLVIISLFLIVLYKSR